MMCVLTEIGDLRDSAEDLQIYVRLAADERDPERRREYRHKARLALGAVRARTKVVGEEMAGWTDG